MFPGIFITDVPFDMYENFNMVHVQLGSLFFTNWKKYFHSTSLTLFNFFMVFYIELKKNNADSRKQLIS